MLESVSCSSASWLQALVTELSYYPNPFHWISSEWCLMQYLSFFFFLRRYRNKWRKKQKNWNRMLLQNMAFWALPALKRIWLQIDLQLHWWIFISNVKHFPTLKSHIVGDLQKSINYLLGQKNPCFSECEFCQWKYLSYFP